MLRASVPEAAIDKDGDLLAAKDDVRSTPQALQRIGVDAIAKAASMKLRAEGELRAGVALVVAPHDRSDRGRGGRGGFGNDSGQLLAARSIGGSF